MEFTPKTCDDRLNIRINRNIKKRLIEKLKESRFNSISEFIMTCANDFLEGNETIIYNLPQSTNKNLNLTKDPVVKEKVFEYFDAMWKFVILSNPFDIGSEIYDEMRYYFYCEYSVSLLQYEIRYFVGLYVSEKLCLSELRESTKKSFQERLDLENKQEAQTTLSLEDTQEQEGVKSL